MKGKFLLLMLLLVTSVLCKGVWGQNHNSSAHENKFGFSTLPFITGTLQLTYEHLLPSQNGIWLAPSVHYTNKDYQNEIGFGLETQYRIYVATREKENHGKNLYFAPYAFFKYFNIQDEDILYCGVGYEDEPNEIEKQYSFETVGAGILFGWQYVFSERVYLDMYAGGGIRETFSDKDRFDEFMQPGFSGFSPKLGVDISFSF